MATPQIVERGADAVSGVAVVSAVGSWVLVNEVAQFVATVIAALSGLVALAYHVWKWRKEYKRKH